MSTWNDVDSGGEFSQTQFSNFESHYIHAATGVPNIVTGDLLMLQLTSWNPSGTGRTFSVAGANGLTWTKRAEYTSGDGKTRSELWYAVATTGITAGTRGSGNRLALPTSSISEEALVYACRAGRGIADTAAWLAAMVEGDFTTSHLQTAGLNIVTSESTFYGTTTIPSVQHGTGGNFTPSVDWSSPGVSTFSYAGNGYPGAVLTTWDGGTDGTEYIRNQHNGGTESWHIWAFPFASGQVVYLGYDARLT